MSKLGNQSNGEEPIVTVCGDAEEEEVPGQELKCECHPAASSTPLHMPSEGKSTDQNG